MERSLAVIIPVFCSTTTVRQLVTDLKEVFGPVCRLHIFLIDDGNEASVRKYLTENCLLEQVTLITLKKNYCQQSKNLRETNYLNNHFVHSDYENI